MECFICNRISDTAGKTTRKNLLSDNPKRIHPTDFIEQIQEWFKETTRKDESRLKDFCKAFEERKCRSN